MSQNPLKTLEKIMCDVTAMSQENLSCARGDITTRVSAPGARVVTPPVITNLSVGVGPSRTTPRLAPCQLPSARVLLATVSAASALWAATAHGQGHYDDPCRAPVKGYRAGQVIRAPVIAAIDGDSLCLALGPTPDRWLEIRESRWFAPEYHEKGGLAAKRVMESLIGRRAVCTIERGANRRVVSYDRVIASCRVDGVPIGVIMRAAGVREGGRGR